MAKKTFFQFMEDAPANCASGGGIAGLPPDSPPVKKKKKTNSSWKIWIT